MAIQPRYPIFVPSKGRYDTCMTMKALEKIGADYRAVVEEFEADEYIKVLGKHRVLVQPTHKSGLVVTRNWIWDYAEDQGYRRFWTFDDNIKSFFRWHQNRQIRMRCPNFLAAIEDFTERYTNVPVAGMHYFMFIPRKIKAPPFMVNRRVYSNMLIETNATDPRGKKYRNEGFYNDDTDLCLRILKDGLCTILFNAFLIEKTTTMVVKGGMTDHYQGDGRWKMAEELRRKHPDVTTITRKWGRWQHHVDYRPFEKNRLIKRKGLESPSGPNEYGMKLKESSE